MDKQDQREQLFERAKHGEITGDEADAEAIALGLGSLSSRPSAEAYRPEAETHWTLPMAVAWIAYRDLDEVREWSAPYRADCWHWIWQRWRVGFEGPVHEGWHLEQRSRPTLTLLSIGEALDAAEDSRPEAISIIGAREALWMALREGRLAASGIDTQTERRVEIPALDWHELVPVQGHGEVDEVRRGLLGTGYRDLLFPAKTIRQREPPPSVTQPQQRALPLSMAPTGDGYIPLYCAAEWIATNGGQVDFDLWDESCWKPAFNDLLAAIASEKVRVTGLRGLLRDSVPASVFAALRVFYPSGNSDDRFLGTGEPYMQSWPYVGEEEWRGGFDDRITSRFEDLWTALMVEKGDIRRLWPFDYERDPVDQRTGLPGRPGKAKHLLEDEIDRRAADQRLAPTVTQEAEALRAWLVAHHPKIPRPEMVTIRNNIRMKYNRLKPRTK